MGNFTKCTPFEFKYHSDRHVIKDVCTFVVRKGINCCIFTQSIINNTQVADFGFSSDNHLKLLDISHGVSACE